MKRALLILFFALSFFPHSHACLNEYFTRSEHSHGEYVLRDERLTKEFKQNFNTDEIQKHLQKLLLNLKNEKKYQYASDYAVGLMKLGMVKDALAILEVLNFYHPDDYIIVANLGTAYELDGQLENAKKFIEKGIELNPQSHNGSEWIHVKILEAKLALLTDDHYLKKNTVLDLNEKEVQSEDVFWQLFTQLQERFPFSPSEYNPIMADLFVALGDLAYKTISVDYAFGYYQLAQKYYLAEDSLVQKRIQKVKDFRKKNGNKPLPEIQNGDANSVPLMNYKHLLKNFENKKPINSLSAPDSILLPLNYSLDEFQKQLEIQAQSLADSLRVDEKNEVEVGSESSKWPTIAWILGAMLVLGIVVFIIRKK